MFDYFLFLDVFYVALISLFLTYLFSVIYPQLKKVLFPMFFASIFLHELAHKAVASAFGYVAFIKAEATLMSLLITIIMFLFFGVLVPPPIYTAPFAKIVDGKLMYSLSLAITKQNALQMVCISIAGPIINVLLAAISYIILKYGYYDTEYEKLLFDIMYKFNLYLTIINILPIFPGNDGWLFMEAIEKIM